jgi:hypothetical protein
MKQAQSECHLDSLDEVVRRAIRQHIRGRGFTLSHHDCHPIKTCRADQTYAIDLGGLCSEADNQTLLRIIARSLDAADAKRRKSPPLPREARKAVPGRDYIITTPE